MIASAISWGRSFFSEGSRGDPAFAATRFLIAKAAMAWRLEEGDYRDDITAIVVYLKDLPEELRTPA